MHSFVGFNAFSVFSFFVGHVVSYGSPSLVGFGLNMDFHYRLGHLSLIFSLVLGSMFRGLGNFENCRHVLNVVVENYSNICF